MNTVKINDETVTLEGFNWNNFDYGDIVWLEDHEVEQFPGLIAAYFLSNKNNVVSLKSLPPHIAQFASKHDADNIEQIIGA